MSPTRATTGLVVEFGVIEAIQEVDGTGALGGEADADLTRELGMGAGHQAGILFVPDLDEGRVIAGAVERAQDAVDAVAGVAEDPAHAPGLQPAHEIVADQFRHDGCSSSGMQPGLWHVASERLQTFLATQRTCHDVGYRLSAIGYRVLVIGWVEA